LQKLSTNLHPIVQFIYETGMRSGAASEIIWDMVDKKLTEIHIPGHLLKNGEDLVLPLVDKNGKTLPRFGGTMKHLRKMKRTNGLLFDSTDLRGQWRQVCNDLSYGGLEKKTRSYRGLRLHDFRRSACRNMTKARIPRVVAMAVSGHKTDSMFKRYAITDKSAIQEALSQA
jgi:integrase